MTIIVRAYNKYSAGAKALALAIGGKRIHAPLS